LKEKVDKKKRIESIRKETEKYRKELET
jgi:hypothetical protein